MYIDELVKRNTAVNINPPAADINIHLTEHGSSWLWAAFSVFGVLMVAHGFMYSLTSVRKSGLKKALLTIPLFTNAVMTYAYYTYASNLGNTGIPVEFTHAGTGVRQIFYSKFIGWFLAWPLVLAVFEVTTHTHLTANDDTDLISRFISLFLGLFTKFLAIEVFVLALLIGALIESSYKWGYFTFGVFALLFVIYLVSVDLHYSLRETVKSTFGNFLIIFAIVVWVLYPICWGLSEGGNVIQPDSEAVFYGILDLINFGLLPTILTWIAVRNVDEEFFRNLGHFGRRDASPAQEKELDTTPRHSGDTAVAPAGVPAVRDEEEV